MDYFVFAFFEIPLSLVVTNGTGSYLGFTYSVLFFISSALLQFTSTAAKRNQV